MSSGIFDFSAYFTSVTTCPLCAVEWSLLKSHVMKFCNPRALRSSTSSRAFLLREQPVVFPDLFRHLGVTITSCWQSYSGTRSLVWMRASRNTASALIYRASSGQWLSPSLITNLWKALVRPTLCIGGSFKFDAEHRDVKLFSLEHATTDHNIRQRDLLAVKPHLLYRINGSGYNH